MMNLSQQNSPHVYKRMHPVRWRHPSTLQNKKKRKKDGTCRVARDGGVGDCFGLSRRKEERREKKKRKRGQSRNADLNLEEERGRPDAARAQGFGMHEEIERNF